MPNGIETSSTLPPVAMAAQGNRGNTRALPWSRFIPIGWPRILGLLLSYFVMLSAARNLAWQLRFDFSIPHEFAAQVNRNWLWVVGLKLLFLALFGQFAGLLSYFSVPDLRRLLFACLAGSAALLAIRYAFGTAYAAPRGVLLADFVFSVMGLSTLRLGFRVARERFFAPQARSHRLMRRVGIIGAGDVGATLVRELQSKRGLGLQPVAFFDDDKGKWRSRVHDIPVVGAPETLLDGKLHLQLEEVIIAMPSASSHRISEIVQLLHQTHLRFETVPSLDQLATGQVKVSQLRNVEVDDLLGRESVELQTNNIRDLLAGRIVMVTGAGGSIGSELCRQIAVFNPSRLLLVEQSEVQIFQIEQELIERGFGGVVLPLVADILDEARMRYIFDRFRPAIVFHAAAHKHVPMMEQQPSEAIKNNTFGAAFLAQLSGEFHVGHFVLISTNKAINPTSVVGATQRLAEVFLQAYSARNGKSTRYIAVRFGNVLGSSGSVLPIFKKQIADGGPVKVTHPEVARYFITIPKAAGLLLQAASQGQGGEIFALDMGQPVKIVDLARKLIVLSGLRPDEDIQIEFSGLRSGERLFEELSQKGDNFKRTEHRQILRFVSQSVSFDEVQLALQKIRDELYTAEPERLKVLIKEVLPDYQPDHTQ